MSHCTDKCICRHRGQAVAILHELLPLLFPPESSAPEGAALQRFQHYFEGIAGVLRSIQADTNAPDDSAPAQAANTATDCFHWAALNPPAHNLLRLFARMTQQLPVATCCEVKCFVAVTHMYLPLSSEPLDSAP